MRKPVFGAAGNVGRRVVADAVSRSHEATAVVRDPARFHELLVDAEGNSTISMEDFAVALLD